MYFTEDTLKFLAELTSNNTRDWFKSQKKRYDDNLKIPFERFVNDLIFLISEYDPDVTQEAKSAIFRIYRDIRFSKDKTPYKTHLSANMNGAKKSVHNVPGYYVHLGSDRFSIGGGSYSLDKHGLQGIREQINEDPDLFQKLTNAKKFKKYFSKGIQGSKNKRIPKEFKDQAESHPILFNKSFYYMADLPAETILDPKILEIVKDYYKAGSEINHFLRSAITDFKLPQV